VDKEELKVKMKDLTLKQKGRKGYKKNKKLLSICWLADMEWFMILPVKIILY